jgi:hypothetical protein
MELGQYQLQIFVGLVVVLAAAFVALICDFLKSNNEQLRELTIELKVRREEEQRHSQTMIPQAVPATAPALRERMRMERVEAMATPAVATAAPTVGRERKRPPSAAAMAAMARGAELAAAPCKRTAVPQTERHAGHSEIRPEIRPEIQTEVQEMYAHPARTEEETSRVAHAPAGQPAAAAAIAKPVTLVARVTTHVMTKPTVAQNGTGAAKKDWGSLLARTAKPTQQVTQMQVVSMPKDLGQKNLGPVFGVNEDSDGMAASTSANAQGATGAVVPTGFHEGYILSRLVQSRQPVSGLVVSIGVNTPRNSDGSMPEPIRKLVESLIGPGDFACQSSSEEFLLIYPNERGASAQRRLSKIAQQLWDFQLRSLGSFSILFSWGGVEVRSESIDEAIASANERMHDTRRGRKLLTMEPRGGQQLRQAV